MPPDPTFILGENAQVDLGVVLGYCHPGSAEPLRIGDHAIIRSASVIYTDTTIGHRFQCGHQVLIRAEARKCLPCAANDISVRKCHLAGGDGGGRPTSIFSR